MFLCIIVCVLFGLVGEGFFFIALSALFTISSSLARLRSSNCNLSESLCERMNAYQMRCDAASDNCSNAQALDLSFSCSKERFHQTTSRPQVKDMRKEFKWNQRQVLDAKQHNTAHTHILYTHRRPMKLPFYLSIFQTLKNSATEDEL